MREYQICKKCVMDTSDPEISFDDEGICTHCKSYMETEKKELLKGDRAKALLNELVEKIKKDGRRKKYDCIIGVSGGVDSTYTAYLVKKLGLRCLAVHLDNGWNSELAVKNIENTLKKLGIDLFTYVIDWEEFRDIQVAFLKASTPDSEVPTDHAIVALLHLMAAKYDIKYIILGRNVTTEAVAVRSWSQGHGDWKYIRSVHRIYGEKRIRTFPHYGIMSFLYYRLVKKQSVIPILNYVNYVKEEAMGILQNELGWKYYGGKHYESIYTRFFQAYILPKKFGFDKKRAHLSTLICSVQITREKALEELKRNDYPSELMEADREYVVKKLGMKMSDFDDIMTSPPKTFWDYPSYKKNPVFRMKSILELYHKIKMR